MSINPPKVLANVITSHVLRAMFRIPRMLQITQTIRLMIFFRNLCTIGFDSTDKMTVVRPFEVRVTATIFYYTLKVCVLLSASYCVGLVRIKRKKNISLHCWISTINL